MDTPIVVNEKPRTIDILFGFLTLVLGAALVRGHLGAETTSGRIVGDLIFGLLTVGCVVTWIYSRRRPGRLEISHEKIVLAYKGGVRTEEMLRGWGDLYVRRIGGRYPRPYLCISGAETRFALFAFDLQEIVKACTAKGWTFHDPARKT